VAVGVGREREKRDASVDSVRTVEGYDAVRGGVVKSGRLSGKRARAVELVSEAAGPGWSGEEILKVLEAVDFDVDAALDAFLSGTRARELLRQWDHVDGRKGKAHGAREGGKREDRGRGKGRGEQALGQDKTVDKTREGRESHISTLPRAHGWPPSHSRVHQQEEQRPGEQQKQEPQSQEQQRRQGEQPRQDERRKEKEPQKGQGHGHRQQQQQQNEDRQRKPKPVPCAPTEVAVAPEQRLGQGQGESPGPGSKYALFKIREESILGELEVVRGKEAQLLEDLRAATHDHSAARLRDVAERLGDACDKAEACVGERCAAGRECIAENFEMLRAALDARQRALEHDLEEVEVRDRAALATVRRELGLVTSVVELDGEPSSQKGKGGKTSAPEFPDMANMEAAQGMLGDNLRALRAALCDPGRDLAVGGLGSDLAEIATLGRAIPLVSLARAAPAHQHLGSPVSVICPSSQSTGEGHQGTSNPFPMPKHLIRPWRERDDRSGGGGGGGGSSGESSRASSLCGAEINDPALRFGPHAFPTIAAPDPLSLATDEEEAERFIRNAIGLEDKAQQGQRLDYRAATLAAGAKAQWV